LEDHPALKSWRLQLLRRYSGRHSEIFEYRSEARQRPIILKRISDSIKPEAADAAIVREFESLQAVRRLLPPQLLESVPEPLLILRDSRALVVEALAGKPLTMILKREANRFVGPLRLSRMSNIGRFTGAWLSQLHRTTARNPLRHDPAAFLGAVHRRLDRCQTVGVASETIEALKRRMTEASHQLEGQPVPAAARQGDFIPQNLLIDGNRLGVVDFESFSECDAIYEDVATFIAYIKALSSFPYYSQRALRRLGESFLQAYGVTGNEPLLRLYLARSLVVLISETNMGRGALNGKKRLLLLQEQLHSVCAELPRAASAVA
jgi:aminoglycoside phosphotransferase (APT) family kinase protein